ncbi:MAG: hypothetical protein Fur0037_04110 [Planctomycetota bacterium]
MTTTSRATSTTAAASLLLLAAGWTPSSLSAQEWTDESLMEQAKGFLRDPLPDRLRQAASILAHRREAFSALCARVHGDYREYLLKIDALLDDLANERWSARETAEKTLVEIGARARAVIEQRAEKGSTLEERIRCKRILAALTARGTKQEDDETTILAGLVMTTIYMDPDPVLLRSLRSALGHSDSRVVDYAIRSLGLHGTDVEAVTVRGMLDQKSGASRRSVLSALGTMPSEKALGICRDLLADENLPPADRAAILRSLRHREGGGSLLAELEGSPIEWMAKAARLGASHEAAPPHSVILTLSDRSTLTGGFLGMLGDSTIVSEPIPEMGRAYLSFSEADILDFPDHPKKAIEGARVFLNQGSMIAGKLLGFSGPSLSLESPVFGKLEIERERIQGIAVDPGLDRLVGNSADRDRVRLRSNEFLEGRLVEVGGGKLSISIENGEAREVSMEDVAGILLRRTAATEPDTSVYTRVDLVGGDRILGYCCAATRGSFVLYCPMVGVAEVPIDSVSHVEIGVGGGAMWGFTLITDYSDNRIVEVDDQGRVVFELGDVYGPWDAECLDNGNLLVTEFSISRVQEVDRKGDVLWSFDKLKNPYDADRLPNGNTLIADTFGGRVIEVGPDKEIRWSYDKEIRPFDADRLPNGNTLIADVLKDRVLEVSPGGEIVWQVRNMNNVHDADRLPNGNTLITLRSANKVIEVDRDGKTVWELGNLESPGDADRLPNGHTLVAENKQVREFDRRGNPVWRFDTTWAVEVNRY